MKIKYAPSKERIDQFLSRYAQEIEQSIPVRLMVAFGSYFNNRYGWGSDLDILLVIDDSKMDKTTAYCLSSVNWTPVSLDIFVYSINEYKQMRANNNPFLRESLKDGKRMIDKLK
ncbi:MAG: nucleotidyltransferase domain-containing protein [Candidatus Heimdallarchaeota archaeon]